MDNNINANEHTKKLIEAHPLDYADIVNVTLEAWEKILSSKIGGELLIGEDVFPTPQIMGSFLHEMIPVLLSQKYPNDYRRDMAYIEKDLVYIPDDNYSVEIKTSSSAKDIFANRSYAQPNLDNSKKKKDGYYLAINFEKFDQKSPNVKPEIKRISFGWLNHTDWIAQKSQTGQQARLTKDAKAYNLIPIYTKENGKLF